MLFKDSSILRRTGILPQLNPSRQTISLPAIERTFAFRPRFPHTPTAGLPNNIVKDGENNDVLATWFKYFGENPRTEPPSDFIEFHENAIRLHCADKSKKRIAILDRFNNKALDPKHIFLGHQN